MSRLFGGETAGLRNRPAAARLAPFAHIDVENPCKTCKVSEATAVTRLMGLIGTLVGGWLGWWIGDYVGLFTAVLLSAIGSGVGLYYGRRMADWMLE